MANPFSVYIHIPFCVQKCSYCGFYSFNADEDIKKTYCEKVIDEIKKLGGRTARPVSSIYFGGGTPSILKKEYLGLVLKAVFDSFCVDDNAEITLEANPADDLSGFLDYCKKCGFNRLSIGVQSSNERELAILGRRHSISDAAKTVTAARKSGFRNISIDLMLGLPDGSVSLLKKSLEYITGLEPNHISAYILKLETGTPLFRAQKQFINPDDDETADQYLYACNYLKECGFEHYEISNFAKPGFRGQHNSAYWQCHEYFGFGPSAHSFFAGNRFHYSADITDYMLNARPIVDSNGGGKDEYIMLGLRLSDGINSQQYYEKFLERMPEGIFKKAYIMEKSGLLYTDGDTISLTDKGMLVSNSIITSFIEEI